MQETHKILKPYIEPVPWDLDNLSTLPDTKQLYLILNNKKAREVTAGIKNGTITETTGAYWSDKSRDRNERTIRRILRSCVRFSKFTEDKKYLYYKKLVPDQYDSAAAINFDSKQNRYRFAIDAFTLKGKVLATPEPGALVIPCFDCSKSTLTTRIGSQHKNLVPIICKGDAVISTINILSANNNQITIVNKDNANNFVTLDWLKISSSTFLFKPDEPITIIKPSNLRVNNLELY